MKKTVQKKLMIVDDHPMMRRGLENIIKTEPDYEVVLTLERGEQVLKVFEEYEIDLLLVDISLPGMNGIELVKSIISRKPDQKSIVISRHKETLYAERALRAGAKGYLMKSESTKMILKAIRKVLNGGVYVSETIRDHFLENSLSGNGDSAQPPMESLSDRELEVFELVGKGKSVAEIAEQLHLAKKTIESYRSRIKGKMGFENATQMLAYAAKWLNAEHID